MYFNSVATELLAKLLQTCSQNGFELVGDFDTKLVPKSAEKVAKNSSKHLENK